MSSAEISRLEDLPDELFLLICRYLNVSDILHGFCSLNRRLSTITDELSQRIDINRIPSKLICRFVEEIFPSISSNVKRLSFSDDYQRFPVNLNQFVNLQSIKISNYFSWNYLCNVEQIDIDLNQIDLETQKHLIEKIFLTDEFSKLKSLTLTSFIGLTFSTYSKIVTSAIEYLKITLKNNVDFICLLNLLSNSIKQLDIHIVYNGPFEYSSLDHCQFDGVHSFHLKTTFEDSIKFVRLKQFVLQTFRSLQHLSIETLTRDPLYIDGYQWELFLNQFVHLKQFSCSIRYRFKISDQQDQFDDDQQILNSFSSDFWLNQHQWFIDFYRTRSICDDQQSFPHYKTQNYGKLYLHTIPFHYSSMNITQQISKAKSTRSQLYHKDFYRNVRHLHYDGENIPLELNELANLFEKFRSINELKVDRLLIKENPFCSSNPIHFPNLKKLILYNNPNDDQIDLKCFDLSLSDSLRYVSLPQSSLPQPNRMPKSLEYLILIECRDYHYDWIHFYPLLRLLKVQYPYFDRLLENHGQLLFEMLNSIYPHHPSMESFQLMCIGINQRKLQLFEKLFLTKNLPNLSIKFDSKSLSIQRSINTKLFN